MRNKKDLYFLLNSFFMDKIYFCRIGNFQIKIFSVMLRTLLHVISVFRLQCVNEFLTARATLNSCAARLRNSLICVDLASPGFLGLKIIEIIVSHVYVTYLYARTSPPSPTYLLRFKKLFKC